MNSRRAASGLGLVAAIAASLSVTSPAALADSPDRPTRSGTSSGTSADLRDDFNGDGYADVAFAAPDATVNGQARAGYVAVMYGSPDGLQTSSKQVFDQDKPGMPGVAEAGDAYGSSVTTADLDRDGYADLVVGAAGEATAAGVRTGSVAVLWGGPQGLSGATALQVDAAPYDAVGSRMVAGDVDGDGAPDLATVYGYGDLRVLSGPFDRAGVPSGGSRDVADDAESRILDLAAGDLDGNGITDIAAVFNDVDEFDARRIAYWLGTDKGLAPHVIVRKADGRRLEGGEHLDVGDVNGDGYADIVAGRAVEGYDSDLDVPRHLGGLVTYLPGSANGVNVSLAKTYNQDSSGVSGIAEPRDRFGTGISIGDVNADGYADVSIGVPEEDFDEKQDPGRVVLMRGTAQGLSPATAQSFGQNTQGVPGAAESKDRFGSATRLVDVNGDGRADLVVGANGENGNAGSIWVLPGTASGVSPTGSLTFGAGTLGTVPTGALLGSVLTS